MTANRAELINAIGEHAGALVMMSEELSIGGPKTYVGQYARGQE